jgi:hypothetical protein
MHTTSLFLIFGVISLVVLFMPGGADLNRKIILNIVLIMGATVSIGNALWPKVRFALREYLSIGGFATFGFLLSLLINYQFLGGDFLHSYRGFPYRWLIGSSEFIGHAPMRWQLFVPGLLADGLFWLNVGVLLVVALHFLIPRILPR